MSLLKQKKGFFSKLKDFFISKPINDDLYEELEELLIQSDMGIKTSIELISKLETMKAKDSSEVYSNLETLLIDKINSVKIENNYADIILVVGVNGVGKTTSIAKLSNILIKNNKKVVVGAADTFRAAAIEQLEEWANKVNFKLIKHSKGSDPAAVVFDTLSYANNENFDITIIDTAGRLHNKKNLMEELAKIKKIINSKSNGKVVETLLVIDSTTGQNGLEQAKIFNEITDISGIILTKYDGTAKGGIIFPIIDEIKKPIKYLGIGEGINDLIPFNANDFVKEIFDK